MRVLQAFPGVRVDPEADQSASIGSGDIKLPADPVGHLVELLSVEVERRSGAPATYKAATIEGEPLARGIAVSFPPPVGSQWAEEAGRLLRSPGTSGYSAALAANESLALAVVDDSRFLTALMMAAPILAAERGISELEAAILSGLSVAERA